MTLARVLLGLLLLCPAPAALAHASLIGSDPPSGAVLDALPPGVGLSFSEAARPLTMVWHRPDGSSQPAEARIVPGGVQVPAPADAGEGSYSLAWRVASADGHPVSGVVVLSVGAAGGSSAIIDEAPVAATALALALRLLALLAMILSVGAALYARLVAPLAPADMSLGRGAALAAPLLAVLALGAYGLDLLRLPLTELTSQAPWQTAITLPRGASMLLMAAAAALALVGLRGAQGAIWLAWGLAALSMAMSGHAATGPMPLAGSALMLLHAAALIMWVGGLPPLLLAVGRPDGGEALRRFSSVALPGVLILAATGLGLLVLRAAPWQVLAASGWGRLLALKLALVTLMLGLAVLNRAVLTPALARDPLRSARRLRRSIAAEMGLGVAVLLVAMCFRLTPPPGGSAAAGGTAAPPGYARLVGDGVAVDLAIAPMPPGTVTITAYPGDAMGEALAVEALWLLITDPVADHHPTRLEARPTEDGGWRTAPVTLPTPGPFAVEAHVAMPGGEALTARGSLPD